MRDLLADIGARPAAGGLVVIISALLLRCAAGCRPTDRATPAAGPAEHEEGDYRQVSLGDGEIVSL